MKFKYSALVYTALVLGAIAAGLFVALRDDAPAPVTRDLSAIEALKSGDMAKLMFHSEPKPAGREVFFDPDGGEHRLEDYRGRYVLVNFWATWCAPCREEMPSLEALQQALGGPEFEVVTIATGRNRLPAIRKFFEEAGVESLPVLLDPKNDLAREMGVLGLPITVILDPNGYEIARLRGDADWSSDSAKAIITALLSS